MGFLDFLKKKEAGVLEKKEKLIQNPYQFITYNLGGLKAVARTLTMIDEPEIAKKILIFVEEMQEPLEYMKREKINLAKKVIEMTETK